MSYLSDLVASTRARVEELKRVVGQDVLEQRIASLEAPRGFARAVQTDHIAVVAEIKRASPRSGPLDLDLNAGDLARAYARGGAAAISVLTEPHGFKGSFEDLRAARSAGLPILRKDFVVDDVQVIQTRAEGADAVLLIVRILADDDLRRLIALSGSLSLDALVEVHDETELERALEAGATLIGINNRDLDTFAVDPGRAAELASSIPDDRVSIALSGVASRAEVERLAAAGIDAVLVGEALVLSPDPEAKVRELAGRQ